MAGEYSEYDGARSSDYVCPCCDEGPVDLCATCGACLACCDCDEDEDG